MGGEIVEIPDFILNDLKKTKDQKRLPNKEHDASPLIHYRAPRADLAQSSLRTRPKRPNEMRAVTQWIQTCSIGRHAHL